MRIGIDGDFSRRVGLQLWRAQMDQMQTSMARLASGLRVNSAVDDAAGLAIAEGMRAQMMGARQAQQNVQDGVNLLRVVDSALSDSMGLLQRMRVLAVQAGNGTYGASQRDAMQAMLQQALDSLEGIARNTQYNTMRLLDGSRSSWLFQVGAGSADSYAVALAGATGEELGLVGDGSGGDGSAGDGSAPASDSAAISVRTVEEAGEALIRIDAAMALLTERRTGVGVAENALLRQMEALDISQLNLAAAQGQIRDVDVAGEASRLMRLQAVGEVSALAWSRATQAQFEAVVLLLGALPTGDTALAAAGASAAGGAASSAASGAGTGAGLGTGAGAGAARRPDPTVPTVSAGGSASAATAGGR